MDDESYSICNPSKKIAIIGAGVSGLLASKHVAEKGFDPIVFESRGSLGGVWSATLASTKLQTPKHYYRFSDFPWPESVTETFPRHDEVCEYLHAYASHFDLLSKIVFNTKVVSIDYCNNEASEVDFDAWDLWGGDGEALSPSAKWKVIVQDSRDTSAPMRVYEVDFVILCIGPFSGLPNVPEFPVNKGPEVFDGAVMHAMDFSDMEDEAAAKLITGKRVTVIGAKKSATDLAVEAATLNGKEHPCTLVFREAHWMMTESFTAFTFDGFTRFSELLVHKPNEGFLRWLFACLLSPLLWVFSKLAETYMKFVFPMKKYNMMPSSGFVNHMFTCNVSIAPPKFYDRVKEGSLVVRKSPGFSFCKTGLVLENSGEKDQSHLASDIVIFATGYKSEEKLTNVFASSYFQKRIVASTAPFYRDCIHPKIPNLAILGYADTSATLYTLEIRSKWLAHLIAGKFKLPSIAHMEDNRSSWETCTKRYSGPAYRRYCFNSLVHIHCNDQLCKDMGYNPRRKGSFFAELFSPYGPEDYKNL